MIEQSAVSQQLEMSRRNVDDVAGMSWREITFAALTHRRAFLWFPLVAVSIAVGATLAVPRSYTSVAVFYPQQVASLSSRLSGLASQLGVNVPGQDPTVSPDFYAQVVVSNEVLQAAAERAYQVPGDEGCPCTLARYWRLPEDSPAIALEGTIRELRLKMTASPGPQTGTVELRLATKSAALSQEISQVVLEQVDRVNQNVRAAQARAERGFIAGRLAVAESLLTDAEAEMRRFLELNRQYQGSPTLMFEWEQLNRKVLLRQDVFANLSQTYESAGIEAVRNTPAIAVPQPPTLPALPDRRWLAVKVIAAFVLGLLLALAYSIILQIVRDSPGEGRPSQQDVAQLAREVVRELSEMRRMSVRKMFRRNV